MTARGPLRPAALVNRLEGIRVDLGRRFTVDDRLAGIRTRLDDGHANIDIFVEPVGAPGPDAATMSSRPLRSASLTAMATPPGKFTFPCMSNLPERSMTATWEELPCRATPATISRVPSKSRSAEATVKPAETISLGNA